MGFGKRPDFFTGIFSATFPNDNISMIKLTQYFKKNCVGLCVPLKVARQTSVVARLLAQNFLQEKIVFTNARSWKTYWKKNLMFCNKFKGCFANARQKLPAHIGLKLFRYVCISRIYVYSFEAFEVVFGFFWQILIWIIWLVEYKTLEFVKLDNK